MNYLAHAYLSFNHPEILLGNMTSDFIKGKQQFDYPLFIQKGIQLHRAIDHYTDQHPITKQIKSFFQHTYRLYSGALVDIVYDHFLAIDKNAFINSESLHLFTQEVYTTLQKSPELLPEKFQRMLPYMLQQNWLYHYQYKEGINKSFNGLARKAAYLQEVETAFLIFNENYEAIQLLYSQFFPEVESFSFQKFKQLVNY